jgi:hypothetical protein
MPTPAKNELPKRVAVIQSNYIPWVGYFAAMASVDLFVVYECVQYTKNDWRNRNQLQSNDGRLTWLTIPIRKNSATQPFMETAVSCHNWAESHFNTLRHHFARTKGWTQWRNEIQLLYEQAAHMTYLFEINRLFLNWVVRNLGLRTPIVYLDSYQNFDDPNERLISILNYFGATHYLSGPAAKSYIDTTQFEMAQIDLTYIEYEKIFKDVLIGPRPIKTTSIMQLILENNHELRRH